MIITENDHFILVTEKGESYIVVHNQALNGNTRPLSDDVRGRIKNIGARYIAYELETTRGFGVPRVSSVDNNTVILEKEILYTGLTLNMFQGTVPRRKELVRRVIAHILEILIRLKRDNFTVQFLSRSPQNTLGIVLIASDGTILLNVADTVRAKWGFNKAFIPDDTGAVDVMLQTMYDVNRLGVAPVRLSNYATYDDALYNGLKYYEALPRMPKPTDLWRMIDILASKLVNATTVQWDAFESLVDDLMKRAARGQEDTVHSVLNRVFVRMDTETFQDLLEKQVEASVVRSDKLDQFLQLDPEGFPELFRSLGIIF